MARVLLALVEVVIRYGHKNHDKSSYVECQ